MSEDALWEDSGSIFRPSYSATWLNCAGALLPSQYASDTAGEDAAIGTVFHSLMAEWQTNGRPDHWLGNTVEIKKEDGSETYYVVIDEEMFAYAEDCLAYAAQFKGDEWVELKVDISSITPIPNQTGTTDKCICSPGVLNIIDWKYGRGVQVFAERNTQLLLYGWGCFEMFDWLYGFQEINLCIAQPRFNHYDCWRITREELIEFADWARIKSREAWQRNSPRSPSPKACQWCKVRVDCPALEALREDLADASFDCEVIVSDQTMRGIAEAPTIPAPDLPSPAKLPTEQLARIYKYRRLMENWFADIGEVLTARAMDGEQLLDWKIVEGRSRRRWRDEQEAAEKLGLLLPDDQLFQRKLVSPNQCEKLLKACGIKLKLAKAYLKTLAVKPKGKPTLAPDGDNRLELPNLADDSFEVEDDL